MELIAIFFTSLGSLAAMFLLTKLMGQRQVSQMSMFDYVNGITIGSIAAEFATSLGGDFLKPLIAMIVYAIAALAISLLSCKSLVLRKFFNGKPIVLFENGKIYEKNLIAAKMDINEFLTQCRVGGYFDLKDLACAILETNGKVSLLPKSSKRPVTPEDIDLTPSQEYPPVNIIIDGILINENLKYTGNDKTWLEKALNAQHIKQKDVFLATCDSQNKLTVYKKTGHAVRHDIFE
ncbi:DUF421 domain-containing protein [uncultured Ruthenibacterium sp.]|mgnify:CR=1 FL=1|uniref:DUF421 domain-containing protein n=1 Tax=uncultured Ruthenibacterium sp. TaxID=1905347 RepID=UPI00349E9C25